MVTFAELVNQQQQNTINPRSFPDYAESRINQFNNVPQVADAFRATLGARNDILGNTQNNLLWLYDTFQKVTNPTFESFVNESISWGRDLLRDLGRQRQQVESQFWPQGTLTRWLDDYFTRMGSILENRAWGNQAAIDAAARASGASRGWIASARARQWLQDEENILRFQEGRVNALMNAYNTFQNLLWGIQDRAANVRSNFIINPYLQMAQRQDQLAWDVLQQQASLEQMRAQQALARRAQPQWGTNFDMQMLQYLPEEQAQKLVMMMLWLQWNWGYDVWDLSFPSQLVWPGSMAWSWALNN